MTDDLSTLLHDRAERADLARLDADDLMRRGDAVVRRRRAGVAGGLAAAAIIATATITQLARTDSASPQPADRPTPSVNAAETRLDVQVWQSGQYLVFGDDRPVKVEPPVAGPVLTSSDVVFRSLENEVWAVGDDGAARPLGGVASGEVESDQDGVLAAWIERSETADTLETGVLAVADLRTDEVTRYDLPAVEDSERLFLAGLEGDTVYLEDNRRTVTFDLATEATSTAGPEAGYFIDAEADVVVVGVDDPRTGSNVVARRSTGDTVLGDFGDHGVVSPDGRHYGTQDDFTGRPVVVDTVTGRTTRLRLGDTFSGYVDEVVGWLDDTTVSVVVIPENGPDSLLTCTVPSGACEVTVADTGVEGARRGLGKAYPGGGFF